MTYLHRLAHRIARFRVLVLASIGAAAACSRGDRVDFLSPFANPDKAVLAKIEIDPKIAAAPLGSAFVFAARGLSESGQEIPIEVVWSAEGGNISPEGRYIGGAVGPFRIIARARQNTDLADTAVIAVWQHSTDPVALIVTPDSATIVAGDTLGFTASLGLANGVQAAGATVSWTASGGEIDRSGRFTASASGIYTVTAATLGGLRRHAKVFVLERAVPQLVSLVVAPKPVRVEPGEGTRFSATGSWSDGRSAPGVVEWTATGGTISSSGEFTAGTELGEFRVIARALGADLADTAQVTVASETPALLTLGVTPEVVNMSTGMVYQFSVRPKWSYGTGPMPRVSWAAFGGTIDSTGVFTAGATPGTFRVIAVGGGRSDTALVILSAPKVSQVILTPASASVAAGGTQQFLTLGTWTDGLVRPVSVSYSATGGTISEGGLYTAGSMAGSFRVIAMCACGLADTAAVQVTVATPPPPGIDLHAVELSPSAVSLIVGGLQQFQAVGRKLDGSTVPIAVTYGATGGSISGSTFTAGSLTGTYRVIATEPATGLADTAQVTITAPPLGLPMPVTAPQAALGATTVKFTITPVVGADRYRWRGGPNSGGSGQWGPVTISAPQHTIATPGPGSQWVCVEAGNSVGYSENRCNSYTIPPNSGSLPTLVAIELSPENITLTPGASQTFNVSGRMSDNSIAPVTVSYIAVQGGSMVGNTYTAGSTPGTYLLVARLANGTLADTSTVVIPSIQQPPPPPPSTGSNEPAGFTWYTERGFSQLLENGWLLNPTNLARIVQDPTAPRSSPMVAEAIYPQGLDSDSWGAPINTRFDTPKPRQLYVSIWFKLSSNWLGHPSGVNKVVYVRQRGKFPVVLSANGVGTGTLSPQVRLQEMQLGEISPVLPPNRNTSKTIIRGQWHKWELLLVANTPGASDGRATWWVDGVLVGDHAGLGFVAAGATPGWEGVDWTPIWGGRGGIISVEQTMRMDHIYVSGKQ